MRNILFVAHDDPGQESRLQCALDVTRAVKGHLNCLGVAVLPADDERRSTGDDELAVIEDVLDRARANRERIEARLISEAIPYSWTDSTGGMVEAIGAHCLLNDLIVVGSHGARGERAEADVAAQIVRSTRRPVLAVPRSARSLDLPGSALVAWDGSAPADTALRAAIPLLRLSARPVICCVGGDGLRDSLKNAAAYCSRHGLVVEAVMLPAGFGKVFSTILQFAKSITASWIAMGAYGHSKLREDLFGGVTRGIIENSRFPVFLAH